MAKIGKINGKIITAIKLLVSLGLLVVFVMQLAQFDKFAPDEIVLRQPVYLLVAFLLMPLNWLLEGVKWHIILKGLDVSISTTKLVYSLFTGVAASLFTPNRSGNFLGRMIWLPNRIKVEASVLTIYGNMAQWIASISFGILGFLLYVQLDMPHLAGWIWGGFILLLMAVFVLFLIPQIAPRFIGRFFWKKSMYHAANVLERKHHIKWQLLLFSMLRHVVFSFQYVLILSAFTIPITWELLFAVWTIYFLMTLAPSAAFGKLLVRENIALFVLGSLIPNSAVIITCSLILWFINLSLPALLGGIIWLKWKPSKS